MLKSKTATWFEAKVKYRKVSENGQEKEVTEAYAVDSMSFTETESKVTEIITPFVSGEFMIISEGYAPYKEIIFDDSTDADKYYACKVNFITIDEKTATEKKSAVNYLVQASNFENAKKNLTDTFGGSMVEYEIAKIADTKILDVILND